MSADLDDRVRLEYEFIRSFVEDVCRNKGKIHFILKSEKVVKSVVEFMISGNRDLIPREVHDMDSGFAFCCFHFDRSLDEIACIQKEDVLSFSLHLLI